MHQYDTEVGSDSWSPDLERDVKRVTEIPRHPTGDQLYFIESSIERPAYTHYLFRFPAKFHPPVVAWALDTFGSKGMTVLDPFTGSGTLQVEALVREMPSVGIDIDPLACFIAGVKTTPLDPNVLQNALDKIETLLRLIKRTDATIKRLAGSDISEEQFENESQSLVYPAIPNMFHWFRRYVTVDLARVFSAIQEAGLDQQVTSFFRTCAAAIIRRVSNADPSPVSGLEVTRIQAERNSRREIRVFDEFVARARKGIEGMGTLWDSCGSKQSTVFAEVVHGDVMKIEELLAGRGTGPKFQLIVTSPPYCTAVDYSRRHKLEMYWLGLIEKPDQHLELAHSYIGRRRVRSSDWNDGGELGIEGPDSALTAVAAHSHLEARALRHYFWSMSRVFAALKELLSERGVFICAIGDSVSHGVPIDTTEYILALAAEHFTLQNRFSYTVRNHYMQYPLRNNKGIREESILVLRRR